MDNVDQKRVMEKTAIISDIHANLEALTSVLEDIEKQEVDRIVCLGDLIGYGADPVAVIEKVQETDMDFVLRGNHDEAIIDGAFDFNPLAQKSIDWTRETLEEENQDLISYLDGLTSSRTEGDRMYVHASPRDPVMEYLLPSDCFTLMEEIPDKIQENFDLVDRLCFLGHTHKPGVITEKAEYHIPESFDYELAFEEDQKYIVNVGSVGQPRDGDSRSCYAISDGNRVEFHKVSYDIKTAQKKIRAVDMLDNRLADRLANGQ